MKKFKPIIALALLTSAIPAQADFGVSTETAVKSVAMAQQDQDTVVSGVTASLVYIGKVDGCDAVGAMFHNNRIVNFRVCGGIVRDTGDVPPSWPGDPDSQIVLKSVVNGALKYGHSQQTDSNGYTIRGQEFSAQGVCRSVEVVILYQNELVDRGIHTFC